MTEMEWELARIDLFTLIRDHPDWSVSRLVETTGHSRTWVKKWRSRFRQSPQLTRELFQSQPRAPKTRPRSITSLVRDTVLSLRDELATLYRRVVGPKTILYHLHRDPLLQRTLDFIPRSDHTIWRILKDGGRIPARLSEHHPVERPTPMSHWEMDFGQLADQIEFFAVVDRGTSILVDTQATQHYNAETALLAVAQLLITNGLPERLRFDRDSRFVGSWAMDGFPAPLVRFLWCLGVQPDPTPPRRPDLKPFVERCIRTLKYECLWPQHPADPDQADAMLTPYRYFYNQERPNQSSACQNQPPNVAFPVLPAGHWLPDEVDPDAWLKPYDQKRFRRRVSANGVVTVDTESYYVGSAYAGEVIAFQLDADGQQFHALRGATIIGSFPIKGLHGTKLSFGAYLKLMLEEARSIDRQQQLKRPPEGGRDVRA